MLPLSKEVEIAEESWSGYQRAGALHRVFDILCSAMGLFFLSPMFCAVAMMIKFDDGGPVFYRQFRIGKGFHRFRVCKFRSMVTNADRNGLLTAPGDSRLTRVGGFLRRYKLDELPQLFNVLKGDMQLVGARPELERYVEMFHPQYEVILQERPGITDPASLAYRHEEEILSASRRGHQNMEQQYVEEILPVKLKLSLAYQKQRTLFSDVRILLQTVFGLLA